jgi:uncharacterized protein DUF1203
MDYTIRGIPQAVADEARCTRRAPGYGHPVHHEIASGTGPCRCCLRPFTPGIDERLLFTYRPAGDGSSLMAPGPIYIHAGHCESYEGAEFPVELRALPLAFEARAPESRVVGLTRADGAEAQIAHLFGNRDTHWLHVRHAEAGCFIARVDRAA